MQEIWVLFLILEDPACQGATTPVSHSDRAWVLEPRHLQLQKPPRPRTCALQQEKPPQWGLCTTAREALLTTRREKLTHQWRPTLNKYIDKIRKINTVKQEEITSIIARRRSWENPENEEEKNSTWQFRGPITIQKREIASSTWGSTPLADSWSCQAHLLS